MLASDWETDYYCISKLHTYTVNHTVAVPLKIINNCIVSPICSAAESGYTMGGCGLLAH